MRLSLALLFTLLACDPSDLDGYSNGVLTGGAGGTGGATDLSFGNRCKHAEVLRCIGFDDDEELADLYTPPDGPFEKRASVDLAMKTSGRGAMRFDVPVGATQNDMPGSFSINFTPGSRNLAELPEEPSADYYNVQIGEGESVYIQWRERIEAPLIDSSYLASVGSTLVLFAMASGDAPGSVGEPIDPLSFVLVNRSYDGVVGVNQFNDPVVSTVAEMILLQNSVGCAYGATDDPDCVRYVANEWMTFQVGVTVGHWDMPDSRFELWVGAESFPIVKVMDHKDRNLPLVGDGVGFGKLHLSLRDDGRSNDTPGNDPTVAVRAWVDELVISRAPIADP